MNIQVVDVLWDVCSAQGKDGGYYRTSTGVQSGDCLLCMFKLVAPPLLCRLRKLSSSTQTVHEEW